MLVTSVNKILKDAMSQISEHARAYVMAPDGMLIAASHGEITFAGAFIKHDASPDKYIRMGARVVDAAARDAGDIMTHTWHDVT